MKIKDAKINDLLELKRDLTINLRMAELECTKTECPKVKFIGKQDIPMKEKIALFKNPQLCVELCPNKDASEKLFLIEQMNGINEIIFQKINNKEK